MARCRQDQHGSDIVRRAGAQPLAQGKTIGGPGRADGPGFDTRLTIQLRCARPCREHKHSGDQMDDIYRWSVRYI